MTFTLDNKRASYQYRRQMRRDVIHCRPEAFTRNSEMLSAYVGVFIMLVMAVYARYYLYLNKIYIYYVVD